MNNKNKIEIIKKNNKIFFLNVNKQMTLNFKKMKMKAKIFSTNK